MPQFSQRRALARRSRGASTRPDAKNEPPFSGPGSPDHETLCYKAGPMSQTASPERFDQVSVLARANVYFGGGVVSHTVLFADGSKKTLGIVFPGTYSFDTKAPERMEVTAGALEVELPGAERRTYPAGTFFDVPGDAVFTIAVSGEPAQYVCSYL